MPKPVSPLLLAIAAGLLTGGSAPFASFAAASSAPTATIPNLRPRPRRRARITDKSPDPYSYPFET